MGDWLGTRTIATRYKEYLPFIEARKFARSLKLKSGTEWGEFISSGTLPQNIPTNPHVNYKNEGWRGMGDWLGTGNISNRLREYRPFNQARRFARSLKLTSRAEWNEFTKSGNLPKDIPANPSQTYKDKGWSGVGDWLGTGRIANHNKTFRPFNQARRFARSLNLKSQQEWYELSKSGQLPDDLPANPASIYKNKGWVNWPDWLGY